MASDPHGWPDPARPGYPANPERDGWHWLMIGHGIAHPFPMLWCASGDMWEAGDDGYVDAADISTRWRYLGPCLTPAEVAAAVQAEREAICAMLSTHVYSSGTDGPYLRPERQAAIDIHHQTIAAAIRARGDTSALDAALAQARREGATAQREHIAQIFEANDMSSTADEIRALPIRAAAGEAGHD